MMYKINAICRKKIDDRYYIFPKKKSPNGIEALELNETGNDIMNFLENNVPINELPNKILELYEVDENWIESVKNDIRIFLDKLEFWDVISLEGSCEHKVLRFDDSISGEQVKFAQLQKLFAEKLLPYKFFIELTYNCNLRCRHCYKMKQVNQAKIEPQYLEKSKIFKILDEIDDLGAIEVYLTGGEVFLHPDIVEILRYATKKNFLTTVLTNGNGIDLNMVDKIKGFELFDIRISVYGNQKCHDSFTTVRGSYNKSITALELLQENMGIGTAVFLVTKENFESHGWLTNFLKAKNIPFSINPHLTPTSEGDLFPLEFRISMEQYYELFQNYNMSSAGTSCSAGLSRFRITPSGEVNPCELIRNISFGNVYNSALADIVNGNKRKRFVKEFEEMVQKHKCNKCVLQNNCNFCPASFNLEMGAYDSVAPYICSMAKIKHEFANM